MFGQCPWLPIDLLFLTQQGWGQTSTIDEYVETLYKWLQKSLQIAQDCLKGGPTAEMLLQPEGRGCRAETRRSCFGQVGCFCGPVQEVEELVG